MSKSTQLQMPNHFTSCEDAIEYAKFHNLNYVWGWLSGADRIVYRANNSKDGHGQVLYWESDLAIASKPIEEMSWEDKKKVLIDVACPHLGRQTRYAREVPVEVLSPWECQRMMVHSHDHGPERRKAYHEKVQAFFKAQHDRGEKVGFGKEYRL